MLQALKLTSRDIASLLNPGFLRSVLASRDKGSLRVYLESVRLVQESSSKLNKSDATWLLKHIRDICRPRSSWLLCCVRMDSPAFKRVMKSDEPLKALFKQVDHSLGT